MPISDLSPLKGMPLTQLTCWNTQVSDLSALKGLPLALLECSNTHVSDLSPLKGMSLKYLSCGYTQVSVLSPLEGMPLTDLYCENTAVTDLSPLKGMNLTVVRFTPKNITKGLDVIRQMKALKTIGISGAATFPPAEFWKKYDAGEFGKPAAAAVSADRKPITAFNDPAFQQWMKGVAALPADKQVEAVVKKLQELNPGFDGKVRGSWGQGTPWIENGVVTGFGFFTDSVADISPVRAFERLRALCCSGTPFSGKSKFSDLSPLKGLPLTELFCQGTHVADLSPLQGMPLTRLICFGTPVSDLSPLKGMPLASLELYETQVSDLSPLKGMPLKALKCHYTNVADLSPLQGMSIKALYLLGTRVSDLSPLKGMKLDHLDVNQTPVCDLSPLEGMNLTRIAFTPKNITKGLDVIRQMKSLKIVATGYGAKEEFPPAEFWKKYDAGEFNK
jgi:Leucine-rich repeat (LRR) protein